ncbi:TMEM164 family acyltransferase [Liberiplasma polymorphum]|jgi:uncharacterized membrane protein YwaF|uniref:TMEM164 family acyltransferase n=1 Tax=Liberiplasma polymorphum TaxID=3374570 RepID=UPI003772EA65
MRIFFGYIVDYDNSVTFFSIHHALYVLFAIFCFWFPLKHSSKINKSYDRFLKGFLFYGLILFEIYYHIHNYIGGVISFPLHLSSFGIILSITLMRFPKQEKLFQFAFNIGVAAGFVALFFPFSYGFPYYNFRYWHFLFAHGMMIFIPTYHMMRYNYSLKRKDFYQVFATVVLAIPIFYFINYLLSTLSANFFYNYWFVYVIPDFVAGFFKIPLLYIFTLIFLYFLTLSIIHTIVNMDKEKPIESN